MPSIDYSNAPAWLQWALAIAGLLTLVIAVIQFIRKGWPMLSRFVATINALSDLPEYIADSKQVLKEQNESLAAIKHEVEYNNGSSVKDAIARVETVLYAAHPEFAPPGHQRRPTRSRKSSEKKENQ